MSLGRSSGGRCCVRCFFPAFFFSTLYASLILLHRHNWRKDQIHDQRKWSILHVGMQSKWKCIRNLIRAHSISLHIIVVNATGHFFAILSAGASSNPEHAKISVGAFLMGCTVRTRFIGMPDDRQKRCVHPWMILGSASVLPIYMQSYTAY